MPGWVEKARKAIDAGEATQSEMAELLGVTRQALNYHLRGANKRRRVENMDAAELEAHRARNRERMRKYREQKKGKTDAD